jgi:hypothetical protein
MQDQKGSWIPVKVMPHTVGNIKNPVAPSNKILFRWPDGQTSDSYAVLGTFDNLPGSNLHLAWLNIEKISHSYGKARPCQSCHANGGQQKAVSNWEFVNDQGAKPFKGTHKIIADNKSLRVVDIKALTPIEMYPDAELADFAPWFYLNGIWKVSGNYSIPSMRYEKSFEAYQDGLIRLNKLKNSLSKEEFSKLRARVVHNPKLAPLP